MDATDPYPPIADYALLADCHSAALVSRALSIDWACVRRFDRASVFGRILDWKRGGYFGLTPRGLRESTRRYVGDSLVLETIVTTEEGRARVLDCFAMRKGGGTYPRHQLLRVVEGIEGHVSIDVCIMPRFDYGELRPWLRHDSKHAIFTAVGGDTALVISTDADVGVNQDDVSVVGRLGVDAGERMRFSLVAHDAHDIERRPVSASGIDDRMDETLDWWARWSDSTIAAGPYQNAVRRSAAVLKGLTCAPTGAIVAAPTTSLPEELGGERNWDYRFSWVRDSALTLAALSLTGHNDVALGFREFIMRSAAGSADDLQIMYGVYGRRHLPEVTLDLEGYRGSRPVRIGNGAASQTQHDVYGHILDAAQLWLGQSHEIDPSEWRFLRQLVEAAIAVWREPDHGVWEMRGKPRHFVHSKVMLWVAIDRGIRLVTAADLDDVDLETWRAARDELRADIETHGVDAEGGFFTQAYGTNAVDASLLVLPLVGFVDAHDERMVATVAEIRRTLQVGPDGFLRRYLTDRGADDGLAGDEGVFLICSFWLVDVLVGQGEVDDARALFDALLAVGNDLGLFAEEYDFQRGELLGNFPQAFTHLALIESAYRLTEAIEPEVWKHGLAGYPVMTRE